MKTNTLTCIFLLASACVFNTILACAVSSYATEQFAKVDTRLDSQFRELAGLYLRVEHAERRLARANHWLALADDRISKLPGCYCPKREGFTIQFPSPAMRSCSCPAP